ncbi:flagellar motor protein MotA [Camelimonas abortus]
MAAFLVLAGFLAWILQQPLRTAFLNNPGLNGLIIVCLAVGVILALAQVIRLYGASVWVNRRWAARTRDGLVRAGDDPPSLMRPVAAMLAGGRAALNPTLMRVILDSVALRLDDARDILRYLAGLLVFLGLLGTFWGLLDTVSSVGGVIRSLRGGADAGVMLDELKTGLSAPLSGMGISFSSSLFGLAGSLVLGFLDLQLGQAQGRFYNGLEEWLAHGLAGSPVDETGAPAPALLAELGRLNGAIATAATALATEARNLTRQGEAVEAAARQAATPDPAIARLADGIADLVQNMRREQQLIRDWVEAQADQQRRLQAAIDRLNRLREGGE